MKNHEETKSYAEKILRETLEAVIYGVTPDATDEGTFVGMLADRLADYISSGAIRAEYALGVAVELQKIIP